MTKRVLIILLLLPCLVSGTDYYVDCSAASNGDGSFETPWNRIWRVNNHVFSTGDDVYFKVGTTCTPSTSGLFIDWNGATDNHVQNKRQRVVPSRGG